MTTYDHDELQSLIVDRWAGDDYALFRYKPLRYQRDRLNAATQLLLDFKENRLSAREEVLRWSIYRLAAMEVLLRDDRNVRFVVALPRSVALAPNEPCEWLAGELARHFVWLTYAPAALVRTDAVRSAHSARSLADRPTVDDHQRTITYAGPILSPALDVRARICNACRKRFASSSGLQWHIDNNTDHRRAMSAWRGQLTASSVLMLDDVITLGSTSSACRQILLAAGAENAIGFFIARTG